MSYPLPQPTASTRPDTGHRVDRIALTTSTGTPRPPHTGANGVADPRAFHVVRRMLTMVRNQPASKSRCQSAVVNPQDLAPHTVLDEDPGRCEVGDQSLVLLFESSERDPQRKWTGLFCWSALVFAKCHG